MNQECELSATLMIDHAPVSIELYRIRGGLEANIIGEGFSLLMRVDDGMNLSEAMNKVQQFIVKAEL